MTQPFEQLVARYQGVVCAVAYAALRDRARSEEIAQEAFLIAWQKLPTLAEPPALPGWLCGIARNLALNAARRRKESAMEREPVTEANPLTEALERESSAIAEQALASLPERDREIVVLYYRGDGTIEDVAGALGVAPATVRKRLERARTRLRSAVAAVEASLRSTRPGPAFTAACVAALATGASSSADAAVGGRSRYVAPAAAGAIAATVVAISIASPAASDPTTIHSRSAAATVAPPPARDEPIVRTIGRDMHAALAAQISARALERKIAASESDPAGSVTMRSEVRTKTYDFAGGPLDDTSPLPPPPDPTALSKATLRYAIREVQPLLYECYKAAADRLPRRTGVITAGIRFVTEPGIATIVDSASVDGELVADAGMAECMRETLLSIQMPPMSEATVVDVNYPFVVR
jgi:RNA polymerase sigma factor (sigma-70 family)